MSELFIVSSPERGGRSEFHGEDGVVYLYLRSVDIPGTSKFTSVLLSFLHRLPTLGPAPAHRQTL